MRRTSPQAAAPDIGVSAGLLVASGNRPRHLRALPVRPQRPDQGIVTGLVDGTALPADGRDARTPCRPSPAGSPAGRDRGSRQRNLTLLADLAAIPVGVALQRALPPRPGEPMAARAAAAGRVAVRGGRRRGDAAAGRAGRHPGAGRRLGAGGPDRRPAVAVPVGLGRRIRAGPAAGGRPRRGRRGRAGPPSHLRSLAVAGGVVAALAGSRTASTRWPTSPAGRLASVLPGGPRAVEADRPRRLAGACSAPAPSAVYGRAMRRIEAGTSAIRAGDRGGRGERWAGADGERRVRAAWCRGRPWGGRAAGTPSPRSGRDAGPTGRRARRTCRSRP